MPTPTTDQKKCCEKCYGEVFARDNDKQGYMLPQCTKEYNCPCHQPKDLDQGWEAAWKEKFNYVELAPHFREQLQFVADFTAAHQEQEIRKLLERHANWKPYKIESIEEEHWCKGLQSEAKLLQKEILALLSQTKEK